MGPGSSGQVGPVGASKALGRQVGLGKEGPVKPGQVLVGPGQVLVGPGQVLVGPGQVLVKS